MAFLRVRIPLLVALLLSACTEKAPLEPVPPGEPLLSVTAGGHTTCALTVSGRAFCWGRGTDGQLGNGGDASQTRPVPVAGGLHFTSLSAGYYHTCGLTGEGTAYCWGARQESHGQLGNSSAEGGSTRPVRVSTPLRFVQLAAGQVHTCGLAADGRAYCWGDNYWGQLGDGTTVDRAAPVPVQGGERFTSIGSGAAHVCGTTTDGRVLCWGDNFFGSVTGNPLAHTPDTCRDAGDLRCTLLPTHIQMGASLLRVTGGDAFSCGIAGDGGWWCWGGSSTEPLPPREIASGPKVTAVTAGSSHTCGLTEDGSLLCQGGNNLGQLGSGDATVDFSPSPVYVQGGYSFISVAAGMFHTCAVTRDGVAYCWGGNRDGQLGNGSPQTCHGSYPCSRVPQPVRNR